MVTKRAYIPALLIALAVPVAVHAETRVLVTISSTGTILYADRDSLRTSRPIAQLRPFPVVQLRVSLEGGRSGRTTKPTELIFYSFNCAGRAVAVLSYKKLNAVRLRAQDWQGADIYLRYQPVEPGSLTESAMAYACSGGKLSQAPAPGADAVEEPDTGG